MNNILFENIIKLEEGASAGLILSGKDSSAVNFFLSVYKYLNSDVVFTKSIDDPACPAMKEFLDKYSEVKDIYDNQENGNPKYLIIKGKNKSASSKGDVRLYFNQSFKDEIYDRIKSMEGVTDVSIKGDKASINWNDKIYTVQESGAEQKSTKRTRSDGGVVANYFDDKVLPATKEQLQEFYEDLDTVYEDSTIPDAIKSSIVYKSATAFSKVEDLIEQYSGKRNGTDNITYNLTKDFIYVLKEAFYKIAEKMKDSDKYKSIIDKVFSGNMYGSGLPAEYIEGSAILNSLDLINESNAVVEFYCSQHFPLIDFLIMGSKITPVSVKDENGGNKSSCCHFLYSADTDELYSMFEDFKKDGFSRINETMEKVCRNVDAGYSKFTTKDGKEPEIGKEYPLADTKNKSVDYFAGIPEDDILDLSVYIASYLIKYSNRKNSSMKSIPGLIFQHFRLGPYGERVLKHNNKFILNQCEKIAVNVINANPAVLMSIQNSIVNFGLSILGTDVVKVKPSSTGFEIIPQNSKMVLRALSSRGGGGKLGIIKNKDGTVQITEVTTTGQGQFFGYEFIDDENLYRQRTSLLK